MKNLKLKLIVLPTYLLYLLIRYFLTATNHKLKTKIPFNHLVQHPTELLFCFSILFWVQLLYLLWLFIFILK